MVWSLYHAWQHNKWWQPWEFVQSVHSIMITKEKVSISASICPGLIWLSHCWCLPLLLQEYLLLAWLLFIFFLILTFYLYPKTMHTYTCNTSFDWPYSCPTFSGYIPFDCFLVHLYYICLLDPQLTSPMPLPLYQYPSYYILNPLPYYWSMTSSSLTPTASLVSDSVPLTIASVCDSASPLPLLYYQSLTQFSLCLSISVLLLTA
jgi:hypothetical protein